MKTRYDYSHHKSFMAAQAVLEDMFAVGEVSWTEEPLIVRDGNTFAITLVERYESDEWRAA